jgi:hypothetical protein
MRLMVIICLLALIWICFLPWVSIPSKNIIVTGMHAEAINFGKPAAINIFFSLVFLFLVLLNKVWSLRTAFFIGAFNFSWTLRNYFALTACSGGQCPKKHTALYLLVLFSLLAVVFLLFISKKNNKLPVSPDV